MDEYKKGVRLWSLETEMEPVQAERDQEQEEAGEPANSFLVEWS